jgi:GT2 family glycosyltransferase
MSTTCVLIVTFNGAPWIRRCLTSLQGSTVKPHAIVVDNASSDDTVRIIESEFPEIELITLSTNSGFGIGNNVGISRALALCVDFIFLLNQDAYVTETTIAELSNFLEEHEDFGLATPLHCSPDLGSVDKKTLRGYLQTYALQFLSDACIGKASAYYQTRGINAAAWFVKTEVFRKIGGFDPIFFMYGEDDDLINRIEYHEIPFALVPYSRIVHLRETTVVPQKSYWSEISKRAKRTRSALIVEIKHPACSKTYMASYLLAKGILVPLANFLIDKDFKELLGSLVATVQVTCEIPRIRRHARLCATPGPHFL